MQEVKKVFLFWNEQSEQSLGLLRALLFENGWQVVDITTLNSLEEYYNDSATRTNAICCCLAILNPVNYTFSFDEIEQLNKFCSATTTGGGNSLIVASGDNENFSNQSNLNELVAMFGVKFNCDCVIRPNPYKNYHPKEARLEDFIVNRGLDYVLRKHLAPIKAASVSTMMPIQENEPRILYARGCTLQVSKLSTIMMTSSKWAIPSRQAICSFYRNGLNNNFRLIAIGSDLLFRDPFIDKEDNKALARTFLEFLVNKEFPINISDAKTIEIPKTNYTPDINHLLDVPICCLQQSESLPKDKLSLIDRRLFDIDNSMLPTISKAFKELNVCHEPLTLIKPNFECKPLDLEPATHGFLLRPATNR